MNTKRASGLVAAIAVIGTMVVPVAAQAQYGQRDRDRYSRSTWNIRSLIDNAERSSNSFRRIVERRDDQAEDRSDDRRNRYNSSIQNRDRFFDALTPRVQRLDEAFERLRREADNRSPQRGRDEMYLVVQRAAEVDRFFSYSVSRLNNRSYNWGSGNRRDWYYDDRDRNNDNRNWNSGRGRDYDRDDYDWNNRNYGYGYQRSQSLNSLWSRLRSDINALARAYDLPEVGVYRGGARYRTGSFGGDWRR